MSVYIHIHIYIYMQYVQYVLVYRYICIYNGFTARGAQDLLQQIDLSF